MDKNSLKLKNIHVKLKLKILTILQPWAAKGVPPFEMMTCVSRFAKPAKVILTHAKHEDFINKSKKKKKFSTNNKKLKKTTICFQ